MPSPFDSREPLARTNAGSDEASAGQPADARMLEQVLDQTLKSAASGLRQGSADWDALVAVARAFRGAPFSVEPVALELVLAILRRHFAAPNAQALVTDKMARQITATLCEDPVSLERLKGLWMRLSAA